MKPRLMEMGGAYAVDHQDGLGDVSPRDAGQSHLPDCLNVHYRYARKVCTIPQFIFSTC